MASDAVDIGHGVTILCGTSGFEAEVLSITPPARTREHIDTSHQETEKAKTFLPADLYDPGELAFDIHFNPDTDPPINGDPETITITFPSGATWVCTASMSLYGPEVPHLDKMTARVGFKVSGETSQTAG